MKALWGVHPRAGWGGAVTSAAEDPTEVCHVDLTVSVGHI